LKEKAVNHAVKPEDFAAIDVLDTLNVQLQPLSFRAGWNKAKPSLWPEPRTDFVATRWSWELAKAGLDAAGRLISTEQAERRNLFMVNPCEGNTYSTLRTLVSAYQMILPGEKASSHRHSANALRFVIDVPENTYTVVDGVRVDMRPNDVLLTPGGAWHGHGSEGDRPGYWIDFLDVPLVHLLEPMFLDQWPDRFQKPETTTRDTSLVISWDQTEPRLSAAGPDEHGRVRVELDAAQLNTMSLYMERLAAGRLGPRLQSTENQICAVVSGSGTSRVGDRDIGWSRGDVFTVPGWSVCQHAASQDAVLFCVSDFRAQDKLGFHRLRVH